MSDGARSSLPSYQSKYDTDEARTCIGKTIPQFQYFPSVKLERYLDDIANVRLGERMDMNTQTNKRIETDLTDMTTLRDVNDVRCQCAARLRRWLAHCLAVDYELQKQLPYSLSLKPDEWIVLVQLGMKLRNHNIDNIALPESTEERLDTDASRLEAIFCATILRPADDLGIPRDSAIAMIRFYPAVVGRGGRYNSQLPTYYKRGFETLAAKLFIDRQILFDAVTDRKYFGDNASDMLRFRYAMADKNRALGKKFFESLQTPTDFRLTEYAKDLVKREYYLQEVGRDDLAKFTAKHMFGTAKLRRPFVTSDWDTETCGSVMAAREGFDSNGDGRDIRSFFQRFVSPLKRVWRCGGLSADEPVARERLID